MESTEGQSAASINQASEVKSEVVDTSKNAEASMQPSSQHSDKTAEKKNGNKLLLVFLGLLAAAAIAAGVVLLVLNNNEPETSGDEPEISAAETVVYNDATNTYQKWSEDMQDIQTIYLEGGEIGWSAVSDYVYNTIPNIEDKEERAYQYFLVTYYVYGAGANEFFERYLALADVPELGDDEKYQLYSIAIGYYITTDSAKTAEYQEKLNSLPQETLDKFIIGG